MLENRYMITECGDLYSLIDTHGNKRAKPKKMAFVIPANGYKTVFPMLSCGRKAMIVHRLVAIQYIPNPHNLPEVNHIDGNKLNNHKDNLEWVTRSENSKHAYQKGLRTANNGQLGRTGKDCAHSVPVNQLTLNGTLLKRWDTVKEAAEAVNGSRGNISMCLDGKRNSHKGYLWQRA